MFGLVAMIRGLLGLRSVWPEIEDYDRYSAEARSALDEANRAAEQLDHEYIGTEHLLLGLLRGPNSALDALRTAGLNLDEIRTGFDRLPIRGPAGNRCHGRRQLTPRARLALSEASDEARIAKHSLVGADDLLIGIVRETHGLAGEFLLRLGVGPVRLRRALGR